MSKICRAVDIGPVGITVFAPENGREIQPPIIIAPDEGGEQWYWTPEEEET